MKNALKGIKERHIERNFCPNKGVPYAATTSRIYFYPKAVL